MTKPSSEITAALAAFQAAATEHARIVDAVRSIDATSGADTPPDIESARAAVADAVAAHALGAGSAAATAKARATLQAAEAAHAKWAEQAAERAALRAGLGRRLVTAEAALAKAGEQLRAARGEALSALLAESEAAYFAAAQVTAQAWAKNSAVLRAMQAAGLNPGNHATLSARLVLPTVGRVTCDYFAEKYNAPHGIGENLATDLLRDDLVVGAAAAEVLAAVPDVPSYKLEA